MRKKKKVRMKRRRNKMYKWRIHLSMRSRVDGICPLVFPLQRSKNGSRMN